MANQDDMIERIVQEVTRRLRAASPGAADRPAATGAPEPLTLRDAVVTLESLRPWSRGGQALGAELWIAPRTVVTPAARDWLSERGVRVRRQAAAGPRRPAVHRGSLLAQ